MVCRFHRAIVIALAFGIFSVSVSALGESAVDEAAKAAGKAAVEKARQGSGDTASLRANLIKTSEQLNAAEADWRKQWEEANNALASAEAEAKTLAATTKNALAASKVAGTSLTAADEAHKNVLKNMPNLPDNLKTGLQTAVEESRAAATKAQQAYDSSRRLQLAAEQKVKAAEAARAKVNRPFEEATRALEAFNNRRNADSAKLAADDLAISKAQADGEKKFRADMEQLKQAVRNSDLKGELSSVRADIANLDLRRIANEQVLNNSRMADFIQVKLEGLMTDDGFCQASKNCAGGTKERIKLDRLFSSVVSDQKKSADTKAH